MTGLPASVGEEGLEDSDVFLYLTQASLIRHPLNQYLGMSFAILPSGQIYSLMFFIRKILYCQSCTNSHDLCYI